MKPYIFVRSEKQFVKIKFCDIICIESLGNYVTIITPGGKFLVLLPLRQMKEILPDDTFYQVNKGCLISLDHVISFDKESLCLTGRKVSFGEKYREDFQQKVTIAVSDVREPLKCLNGKSPALKQS